MTYVVVRPDRRTGEASARYEIRESVSTPAGPRARTLATFRVLTTSVLAEAATRARRPFDARQIRARAAALGAPQRTHEAAATATALLAQLRRGEPLPPALTAELRRVLPERNAEMPDSLESALEWVGVEDAARGRTLRDLLDLADRLPTRARPPASSFPRLSSERPA